MFEDKQSSNKNLSTEIEEGEIQPSQTPKADCLKYVYNKNAKSE